MQKVKTTFQPGEEKAPKQILEHLPVPRGGLQDNWRGTFTRACSSKTSSDGFKLSINLDQKAIAYYEGETMKENAQKCTETMPREVAGAPSLKVFRVMFDGALSNLIQLKMSLPTAKGLEQDDL